MAKEHTFDVSAKVEKQELKNALDQAKREIETRYDFKNSTKEIDFNETEKKIYITSDSENKCEAIYEIILSKAIKREIPSSAFELEKSQSASGGKSKLPIKVNDTLKQEDAKKIVAQIKESKIKVTPSIQGDSVRVKAKSIDDLQETIKLIKSLELNAPIVFENFK